MVIRVVVAGMMRFAYRMMRFVLRMMRFDVMSAAVMGMRVVVVVMVLGSEHRTGKNHKEQYGGKEFLHAKNVTRRRRQR